MSLEFSMDSLNFCVVTGIFVLLGLRLVRLPRGNLRGVIEVFGAFQVIIWAGFFVHALPGFFEFWAIVPRTETPISWSVKFLMRLIFGPGIHAVGVYYALRLMRAKKNTLFPLTLLAVFVSSIIVVTDESASFTYLYFLAMLGWIATFAFPLWFRCKHKEAFT